MDCSTLFKCEFRSLSNFMKQGRSYKLIVAEVFNKLPPLWTPKERRGYLNKKLMRSRTDLVKE